MGRAPNWTIGPRFRLVRPFDLAPPSGRVALGGRFPGLKLWAEFSSPFEAQKGIFQGMPAIGNHHDSPTQSLIR